MCGKRKGGRQMGAGRAHRERKDPRSGDRADFTLLPHPSTSLSLSVSLSRSHADWEKAAPFFAQTRTLTHPSARTEEPDGHL